MPARVSGLTDVLQVSPVPDERPAPSKAAAKPKPKALPNGMPRRYPDHRTQKAKRYKELYDAVIEQYHLSTKLACWLSGLAADLMEDYTVLKASKKKATRSQRRKVIGLLYGSLREVRNASGHAGADDLSLELSKLMGTK